MIRPRDIKNKRFRGGLNGYNKKQVDSFLSQIYIDYQELYAENLRLIDENNDLRLRISDYVSRERSIDEAESMARRVIEATNKCAKDKYEEAQKKVRGILENAQKRAEAITGNALTESGRIIKQAENDAFDRALEIVDKAKGEADEINKRNQMLMRNYNRMRKRILELIDVEADIIEKSHAYVFKDLEKENKGEK